MAYCSCPFISPLGFVQIHHTNIFNRRAAGDAGLEAEQDRKRSYDMGHLGGSGGAAGPGNRGGVASGAGSAGVGNSGNNASGPGGHDEEEDDDGSGAKERRKIEIRFIEDKGRRHITFSKRKAGIMKKAYELSVLTGTQVLLLVVSETGLVYTFTTPKLQPLVTKPEGKNLIQTCLNAPDSMPGDEGEGEEDDVTGAAVAAANAQGMRGAPQPQSMHPSQQMPPHPGHMGQHPMHAQMGPGVGQPSQQPGMGMPGMGLGLPPYMSPEQAAAYQQYQYFQGQAAAAAAQPPRGMHPQQGMPGLPPHLAGSHHPDVKDYK